MPLDNAARAERKCPLAVMSKWKFNDQNRNKFWYTYFHYVECLFVQTLLLFLVDVLLCLKNGF